VTRPTVLAEPFRKALLEWWSNSRRTFPWRETNDPYKILVAEILLHRTRAGQVASLYCDFLQTFPSIQAIAQCSTDDLASFLHSIGLRWRSDSLHDMAKTIIAEHEGRVPQAREQLEALPGVGPYIAGAVRCFAFGYPEPMLDTNTVRVLGRVFGLPVTDASRRSRRFRSLLELLLDTERPREFNLALIDLGAVVCTSRQPLCSRCPFRQHCVLAGREKAEG
jgi:A/G-specific adenine glycosylase